MGKRGPAPKPTALRVLHGDRKDRINRNEPQPRVAEPQPPAGLSDEVLGHWHFYVGELRAMHTLAAADRDSLVCLCEAVARHRRASELLAGSDVLVKGLHGGLVRNPAVAVQRDAALEIRAFAQEFGLTPSARSVIKLPEGSVGDGADLLSG